MTPLTPAPIPLGTLESWRREIERARQELHLGCVGAAMVALTLLQHRMEAV